MSLAPGATVFFDRDGTLIRDVDYLCRVADIWQATQWIIAHASSAAKQEDQP